MTRKITFPLRLKILVTVLLAITAVLSAITFSMANLFHEDKRTYVSDMTSVMALSMAEESRSLLLSYGDRLESYGRVMQDPDIAQHTKTELLRSFFDDFEELISLAIYEDGALVSSAFDGAALDAADLSQADLLDYRREHPVPPEAIADGRVHVENSTLSRVLPSLTMTHAKEERGNRYEVSATVHLGDLLELSARSRLFLTYLVDGNGVLLAHPEAERVAARESARMPDDIDVVRGGGSASIARLVDVEGESVIAGHAGADVGGVIAAVEIPERAVYLASRTLLRNLLMVALSLLLAAAILSMIGSRQITRPIERLVSATRAIGRGEFQTTVAVESADEIGMLATSFNHMAAELHQRERELERAQEQLVQSEKLAALGELGAAIAHEVKNPLAGILGCAQLSLRKLKDTKAVERNLGLIDKETKRCKTIVENLLTFARPDDPALEEVSVNQVVSDTSMIVRHQLEMNGVELTLDLDDAQPAVHGNANQLQQVLMNLVMNAQQAMAEGGDGHEVRVSTRREDGNVVVLVADDGAGMPDDVRRKVFDPFFSTKPRGKGTGLGLSVTFGIVRDHKGEISVDSTPGEGTTFRIVLPDATSGSATNGEAAA